MKILNYMNIFLVGISIILIALGFITKESSGNLIGYGLMFYTNNWVVSSCFRCITFILRPQRQHAKMVFIWCVLIFLLLDMQLKYYLYAYFGIYSICPSSNIGNIFFCINL